MAATLKQKIAEVFDEPGCDKNQAKSDKERKKGCTKQLTPGAAAGGCAFDGAKIALQPIADVAHLVHGPIACEGNSWDNRSSASSGARLYRTGFTTDIGELDVIYGGEKRLYKSIREIIEKYDPPAVFVYQTCVTALIGDDIEAVCKKAAAKFGKPVIPVNAPGFVGPKNLGNKLGGEAILDYVIGTREPEHTTPYDINIIGEYNLSGELWQVKPLLDALGIRVLSCISGDGRYDEIAAAHRARANMMVCSKSMINVATRMQQTWGIPYFEGSFYGIGDMSDTLRQIARLLVERGAGADLIERTERLIAVEEARAWKRIGAYKARLAGKKVLLITGGVKSWSVVAALQEAGMEVVGTSVKKSTREDKERIKQIMGEDAHMIDDMTPREMYAMLREARADIMLSGGRSQFVALKARMPWLDINQERHYAYAGYEGMVDLVREIDKELSNPVWEQVRLSAPWERTSSEGLGVRGEEDVVGDDDRPLSPHPSLLTEGPSLLTPHPSPALRHASRVVESRKACAVNPLKMSQPLGAAYAFMGIDRCMPTMHGSQGCTSFGLVLLVRHFKEAIPLQTTAMNEVTTILGGYDNIEKAVLNIRKRANPALVAICSTGLTETKGDDVEGYLKLLRQKHPELDDLAIVYVSTPDYIGAFQDGYAKAVAGIVAQLCVPSEVKIGNQLNVLPGAHLTPGDIEELREIIEAFGLMPIFLPDHSGSLDGHIPDDWTATTTGGTGLEALRAIGASAATIAIGEHMRSAAIEIEMRTDVPYRVFDRLTGLEVNDQFLWYLAQLAGVPVPPKYRRQRSQLLDAMLDGHFHTGGKKIALGAEPDLLWQAGKFLSEMGCELAACVTTTHSPVLERLPCEEVLIGDLEDLETRARDVHGGCDLLITHAHGRQAAERLGLPLYRIGMPMFDRVGNAHIVTVGYRGTRNLVFDIANVFLANGHEQQPGDWPLPEAALAAARGEGQGGCGCSAQAA